jgi:hypothetical protein
MNRQFISFSLLIFTIAGSGCAVAAPVAQTQAGQSQPTQTQPVQSQSSQDEATAKIIAAFRRCTGTPKEKVKTCQDGTMQQVRVIQQVAALYWRGDEKLLPDLLEGAVNSDGAIAESYATFLADLLARRPEAMLEAAQSRSESAKQTLFHFAAYGADGKQTKAIQQNLGKIAQQPKHPLAKIAVTAQQEIQRFHKEWQG